MNRKIEITITVLFIITIFAVGIVQAISELKKGETVQFIDALEDTFITPVKKKGKTAELYSECKQKIAAVAEQLKVIQNSNAESLMLTGIEPVNLRCILLFFWIPVFSYAMRYMKIFRIRLPLINWIPTIKR